MDDPLTAWSVSLVLWCRLVGEGGITLTLAPVFTRKHVPEAKSWKYKRQLKGRPGSLVTASNWPGRFATWSKVVDTWGHYYQTESDTRRGWEVGRGWRCGVVRGTRWLTAGVVNINLLDQWLQPGNLCPKVIKLRQGCWGDSQLALNTDISSAQYFIPSTCLSSLCLRKIAISLVLVPKLTCSLQLTLPEMQPFWLVMFHTIQ